MNCPRTEEISQYLDNELSEEERERLEAHLKTCEICQRELAEQRKIKESLAKLGLEAIPEEAEEKLLQTVEKEIFQKKSSRWLIPAALIPIAAVFLVFLMQFIPFSSTGPAVFQSRELQKKSTSVEEDASQKSFPLLGKPGSPSIPTYERARFGLPPCSNLVGAYPVEDEASFYYPNSPLRFTEPQNAKKELSYQLYLPSETLGGKITEILISSEPPLDKREVLVFYDNGLAFKIEPKPDRPPNYLSQVRECEELKAKENISLPPPFIIKVNGATGIAGYDFSPPSPAYIIWYENGMQYIVRYLHPVEDASFGKLMKVASSLKKVN